MSMNCLKLFALSLLLVSSLTGCSREWWERGQAPSVPTLLDRSSAELKTSLDTRSAARPEIAPAAKAIQQSLLASLEVVQKKGDGPELMKNLTSARDQFIAIDQLLSIGSRAPYAELSGELRVFITKASKNGELQYPAFGMFTARTMFFLANELTVPAPVVQPLPAVG